MSFTFSTSLMASNYAGHTKKTTASGIIFVGWAAGLIAGPRESVEPHTHRHPTSYLRLILSVSRIPGCG
jgi:ACS family allantoate permease-like MFS transporter